MNIEHRTSNIEHRMKGTELEARSQNSIKAERRMWKVIPLGHGFKRIATDLKTEALVAFGQ